MKVLDAGFFDRDAGEAARALLGKVVRHRRRRGGVWLAARIVETEAYYGRERASHASLGWSPSRRALFSPPGTLYMYYARGGDSLNVSCGDPGDAVLVKAGVPWFDGDSPKARALPLMRRLNPVGGPRPRPRLRPRLRDPMALCSGQVLLCRSLGLRVAEWNDRLPERGRLEFLDAGVAVPGVVRCRRLGIPAGRDGHLSLRFVDASLARHCTKNPLSVRAWREGRDYVLLGGAGEASG